MGRLSENALNHYCTKRRKPFEFQGETMRVFDRPDSCGLRFIGLAHDIADLDHKGWFIDTFQYEFVSGVVYAIPGKNRRGRFLAGYTDDSGEGVVILSMRIFEADPESEMHNQLRHIGEKYRTPDMFKPSYWGEAAQETAKKEAARYADQIAEIWAERERNYQESYCAGVAARESVEPFLEAVRAQRDRLSELRKLRTMLCGLFQERRAKLKNWTRTTLVSAFASRKIRYRNLLSDIADAWDDIESKREIADNAKESLSNVYGKENESAWKEGYYA